MTKSPIKQSDSTSHQRRKAARPGEIVASALELFVEHGFAATRLEDVAHRAGVSKGTVYLYFDSKEALFEAVVREVVIPQVERSELLAQQHQGSQGELLEQLVMNWWQSVSTTRVCGIPKLIIAESANFPQTAQFFVDNVIQRVRGVFSKVIEKGIEQGEFRQVDPEYATRLLMSPMVLLAIWRHSLQPYDQAFPMDEQIYLQQHLDLFLNGLRKEMP
ncbi:TetR family transcriptional regulator [Thiohalophilus sp.]|uniref:TetR family transcriptional regulator n=1 Tax=Thiohalophilus sp. TaxID=3028392 RepID=UPI0039760306